jgi:hypothetical protein
MIPKSGRIFGHADGFVRQIYSFKEAFVPFRIDMPKKIEEEKAQV